MFKWAFMFIQNSILPFLAAGIVLLAASGLGLMLLKLLKSKNSESNVVELPIGMVFGLGIFGYISDFVYMMQIVDMRFFFILLILLGLACFKSALPYVRTLLATREMSEPFSLNKLDYLYRICGWVVVALLCLALYIHNAVPVCDNDSLVHYAFLSKMIAAGVPFDKMLLLRNMPITDLNRLIPMVYAPAYFIAGSAGAHLMNFVFILITAALIHLACVYYFKKVGLFDPLPILTLFTIREFIHTGIAAKVDYGVAMLIVAAAIALVSYRARSFWVLSIFFGLIICSRTSAIYMALAMMIVFWVVMFWDDLSRKPFSVSRVFGGSVLSVCLVGIGSLAVAAPPYVLHYFIYGNPVFPFCNKRFGHYEHFYDYVLFQHLRYKVSGFFAPVLIYLQLLVKQYKDLLPGFYQFGLGLSPFFIFAPFAITKKKEDVIVWLFFILGYLFWAIHSSHTHRSLLGVAFIGVILIVNVITRLRKIKIIYFVLSILVLLATYDVTWQIAFPDNANKADVDFCAGRLNKDIFYQEVIKAANTGYFTPSIKDLEAIRGIIGNNIVTCLNIYPQLYPGYINIFRFDLAPASMKARLMGNDLDELDRYTLTKISSNTYLQHQYGQLSQVLWPASGAPALPRGRREVWGRAQQFQDVNYFLIDAVLECPERIVNIMKFNGSRFLLTHRTDVFIDFIGISSLKLVWQSGDVNLFEVIDNHFCGNRDDK